MFNEENLNVNLVYEFNKKYNECWKKSLTEFSTFETFHILHCFHLKIPFTLTSIVDERIHHWVVHIVHT